jgi:5-keto 4-deoxyuronate isomerase
MQKVINFLALTSFVVSAGVVAGGVYVYQNQEALVENAKREVTDAVKDLLSQSELGSVLVGGSSNVDVTDEALDVESNPPVEIPVVPF